MRINFIAVSRDQKVRQNHFIETKGYLADSGFSKYSLTIFIEGNAVTALK
jgi:hypothetical protein